MSATATQTNGVEIGFGQNPFRNVPYVITGANTEADAITALLAAAPTTVDALARTNTYTLTEKGGDVWEGKIAYKPFPTQLKDMSPGMGPLDPIATGHDAPATTASGCLEFSFGVKSEKIYNSGPYGGTDAHYPSGAVSQKGFINVGKDSVDGVDRNFPTCRITSSVVYASEDVTSTLWCAIGRLVGKTNQAAFRGFAIGEVMFMGGSLKQRDDGDWNATWEFEISENKTGLSVGTITGIAKKGWQYLWTKYQDGVDTGIPVKIPLAVFVENIYESGDFGLLKITSGSLP